MAKVSGIRLITAERKRQIEKEGWSLEHILELHRIGDQVREQFDKFVECEKRAKKAEEELRTTPLIFDFKKP